MLPTIFMLARAHTHSLTTASQSVSSHLTAVPVCACQPEKVPLTSSSSSSIRCANSATQSTVLHSNQPTHCCFVCFRMATESTGRHTHTSSPAKYTTKRIQQNETKQQQTGEYNYPPFARAQIAEQ